MRDKKLPLWLLALTLALCAVLAGVILWQGGRLRALSAGAPAPAASSAQEQAPVQEKTPVSEEAAASEAPGSSGYLVKSLELTPAGVDEEKGTASAEVSLQLWNDRPDAAAELLVRMGEASDSIPLHRSDSGVYTATLTLPLPGKQDGEEESVSLAAAVEAGGLSSRELLREYPNTRFMTAALRADLKEGGMTYVRKALPAPGVGVMRINPDCRLSVLDGGVPVAVREPSFRLYCNEKLIKLLPAAEDEAGLHLYGPQAWDNALVCRNGDNVAFAFSCFDGDGRFYEFQLETVRIVHGHGDVATWLLPPAVS